MPPGTRQIDIYGDFWPIWAMYVHILEISSSLNSAHVSLNGEKINVNFGKVANSLTESLKTKKT